MSQEEDEYVLDCDDELFQQGALAIIILLGAELARTRRARRRNRHRLYLCRPQLLPNPRFNTPWQRLYESRNDRAFITTKGVDVETFHLLLLSGFQDLWDHTTIRRADVHRFGAPRLGRRSLDAAGALGLVLHFLSSTMSEVSLQQIFALIPTTVSRYTQFAKSILLQTLRALPAARISWPKDDAFEEYTELICARHPLLRGAFGTIDGLNLAAKTAADQEVENATYNGWLHTHCISSIFAFSPRGAIIACTLNAPGSWHDSRVARAVYEKLRLRTPEGFYLVADTAFPRGTNVIEGKIKAPVKSGERLPGDPHELEQRLRFDRQLLSYRQTAEWGMRGLQGSFGRLRMPLDINDETGRHELLEVCARLNNVRAECVGINQVRNVYVPLWRASEDERLWDGFETMLFDDVRKGDRVSRFHLVVTR